MSDVCQWDELTSLRDLTDLNMSDGRQWDVLTSLRADFIKGCIDNRRTMG